MASLQSHCLLAIIANVSSYTADVLSLIPPRLRTRILIHLPAIDLYRLSKCHDFLTGLKIDIEEVWKHRFHTTLLKYTNLSPFDEIPSRQISWRDRYLLSCLQNIPHQYQTTEVYPFGGALFVIGNITFSDTGSIKLKVGSTVHGLHCVRGKSTPGTNISSYFVSFQYLKLLNSYPYNVPVGSDIPTMERIKLFTKHFPNWSPSVFPLEYDDDSTDFDETLVKDITDELETVFICTQILRKFRNAECTEYDDKVDSPVFGETTAKIIDVIKSNTKCNDIVISQPAMFKSNIEPVSFSSAQLLEKLLLHFPNLKQLSVTMHNNCLDCINHPLFLKQQLTSLHLRVARPNFKEIVTPSIAITNIRELRLHGIHIAGSHFINILLAYLNVPTEHEQSLSLGSLKVEATDVPAITPQTMTKACCYKKSLYLHRVDDNHLLETVFAAYPEILFNTFFLSLSDRVPPFPENTVILAKRVILQRTLINTSTLAILKPVLQQADKVELSVSVETTNVDEQITLLCQCISICQSNLQYLDFNRFLPLRNLSQILVDKLFTCIFSLPASTVADLVINPAQVILSMSNILMQQRFGITQKQEEMPVTVNCWKMFYEVWKREGKKTLKSVNGVPDYVLDELEDQLEEMTSDINICM